MRILNFFAAIAIVLLGGCTLSQKKQVEEALGNSARTVIEEMESQPYKCELVQFNFSKEVGLVVGGAVMRFKPNVVTASKVVSMREGTTTYIIMDGKDEEGQRVNFLLTVDDKEGANLYNLGSHSTWPFGYIYRKPYMYISQWEPYGNMIYLWKATPDDVTGPKKTTKDEWNKLQRLPYK